MMTMIRNMLALAVTAALVTACTPTPSPDAAPPASSAAAIPQTGELPQGHPALSGPNTIARPPEPGSGTGATGLERQSHEWAA